MARTPPPATTAVLLSGGLDSAVLLAAELGTHDRALPIFVRSGLAWEAEERDAIDRLLARPPFDGRTDPLVTVDADLRDVYPPNHWAVAGRPPAFDTPDEDVYLPGRNIILISKAAVLCARLGIERLALGPLAHNPFPDATPEFFASFGHALSMGLARRISLATPLADRRKVDVVRLGLELGVPLDATLSCMSPRDALHCGECSKCRERRDAFRDADVADRTRYAAQPRR